LSLQTRSQRVDSLNMSSGEVTDEQEKPLHHWRAKAEPPGRSHERMGDELLRSSGLERRYGSSGSAGAGSGMGPIG
jgi:hypothetical protein